MNESDNDKKEQKAKLSNLAIASFVLAVIPFVCLNLALFQYEMDRFLEVIVHLFANKSLHSYNESFFDWVYLFIRWPVLFIFSVPSIVFSVWGLHNIVKSKGFLRGTVFAELGLSMSSIVLGFYIYNVTFLYSYFPVPE